MNTAVYRMIRLPNLEFFNFGEVKLCVESGVTTRVGCLLEYTNVSVSVERVIAYHLTMPR